MSIGKSGKVFLLLVLALVLAFGNITFAQEQSSEFYPVEQYVLKNPDTASELYIFNLCMRNIEFFDVHIEAFELAGQLLGVKTMVMGPSAYDTPAQISSMKASIAMNPAGILIFPPGPELGPVINQAIEAGIPVVTICGDVPGSKRIAFVGINQYEVGVVGGEYLAKILNEKGKIGILSMTAPMFQDRAQGYRDTFAKYPEMKIAAEGDTKADLPTGISVAKSILTAHPDLNAFVCVDSVGAMSAVTAVKEAGLVGKVKILGMDRNSDTVQYIGKGLIDASVAQKGHLSTFYGMQILFSLRHNPMPVTTDNEAAGIMAAPVWINTGVTMVTKDNWEYFLRQW